MKKISLVFVVIFCCAFIAGCNPKPESAAPSGYGLVKWGDSPDTIRAAYALGEAVKLEQDKDDPSIVRFTQTNVSANIAERVFIFHDNKLYRVWVTYTKDANLFDIRHALQLKYGVCDTVLAISSITTTSTPDSKAVWDGGIVSFERVDKIKATPNTTYEMHFRQYAPEIVVILFWNDKNVSYTWEKYRDEFMKVVTDMEL